MNGIFKYVALLGCVVVVGAAGCSKSTVEPPNQTEISEFQTALQDGDADIVDRLIKAKPSLVNTPDPSGKMPLTVANEKGATEVADVLKKHGAHE